MAKRNCGAGQRHAEESEQEGSGELRRTEAALRQALQQSEADRARLRTQHAGLSRRHDATKQELEERTESAAHLLRELEASMYQVSGGTLRASLREDHQKISQEVRGSYGCPLDAKSDY